MNRDINKRLKPIQSLYFYDPKKRRIKMVQIITRLFLYIYISNLLNDLGNKAINKVSGKGSKALPLRTLVVVASMATSAVAVTTVTNILFNDPEAAIDVASEIIN